MYIHTYIRDPDGPPWRLKYSEEEGGEERVARLSGWLLRARAGIGLTVLGRWLGVWRQHDTGSQAEQETRLRSPPGPTASSLERTCRIALVIACAVRVKV